MAADPTPRALPGVRRELALVPAPVRTAVRGLFAGERPWPLYVYGASGVGKTSPALLMPDAAADPGGWVRPNAPGRASDWLNGFAETRAVAGLKIDADRDRVAWSDADGQAVHYDWDGLVRHARERPLFVLDDIGVGAASDFRLDLVLEVLGLRCVNPARPLVVTGNFAPGDLAGVYDERVARRVTSGTGVEWRPDRVAVWECGPRGGFGLVSQDRLDGEGPGRADA